MRRTLGEWIEAAGRAEEAGERGRCLDAAIERADGCWEWRQIVHGVAAMEPLDHGRLAAALERMLAIADEELAVWGFIDAAVTRARALGDDAGAAAALAAGVDAFRRGDVPAYRWCLLAGGTIDALGDEEGARRCLEHALARARRQTTADERCDVARALAGRGDREGAIVLLREAEALPGSATAAWSIANVWSELGERAEVERVLDAAIPAAETCDDALRLAHAAASHRHAAGIQAAIDRARRLARDADAWLEIAEAAFDVAADAAVIREALAQAVALAGDDAAIRERVAAGYVQWLDDREAAATIGPRGVRPEALRIANKRRLLAEMDASGLFDRLRARIPEASLERIAAADYGHGAGKNLAALRDLCASGLVPRSLDFGLHEVCALTRWSEGAGVDHHARALACILLFLDAGDHDPADSAPILVESCLALGDETRRLGVGFFAWIAGSDPRIAEQDDEVAASEDADEDEDEGADGSALVGLALLVAAGDPGDAGIARIVAAIDGHPWLTAEGLRSGIAGSLRRGLWEALIATILVPAAEQHPAVAELLLRLGVGS